jgi:hypothetical protein
MNYAVEIGSGAMIYISNFIKIVSAILKLIRGIQKHKDIMMISQVLSYFFNIRKVGY